MLAATLMAALIVVLLAWLHENHLRKQGEQHHARAISVAVKELILDPIENRIVRKNTLYIDERTLPTILTYVRRSQKIIDVITNHTEKNWSESLRREMEREFFDCRGEEIAGVLMDPFGLWVSRLFYMIQYGSVALDKIVGLEVCEHGTPRFRIEGERPETSFPGCDCTAPRNSLSRPTKTSNRTRRDQIS